MSVHIDTMTHAVTRIIEESWTVQQHNMTIKKFGSAEKLAVNMSAEKNMASRNLSRIFPKPAKLLKKFGLGV